MSDDTKDQEAHVALTLAYAPLATKDPDVALVSAAKNGDRRAFAELFSRHYDRIFAMCTRLLRDRAEVEDAVQQTFLEAWRSLHRFEGRSKFTTWLTRIAINTSLGFRRRVKRLIFSAEVRPEAGVSELGWGSVPRAPSDLAEANSDKAIVHEILLKLSAKKRVVFVLSELEGQSAPEIAEVLGIPDATVRTRLFHARKEFARLVAKHPVMGERS